MKPKTEGEARERAKNDPKWFIERFLWLVNKERKTVPFILNPPQARFYKERTKNDLILKDRKQGFSTLIEALNLHACLFFDNENAVTMAHTWDDTSIHLDRVKYFLETMGLGDMKIEVPLDKENQRELYFTHTNSRYWIGTAGSRAFGRGRDITRLHLSELAHYPDQTVVTGVMEACVPGAWKAFETTANGVGELFHRLWQEAGDPNAQSPWKRHFFPWWESPENVVPKPTTWTYRPTTPEAKIQKAHGLSIEQMLWWRSKRAEMADKTLMAQEHPSSADEAFLSSGMHPFDLEKLKVKREAAKKAPPADGNIGYLEDDGQKVRFVSNIEGPFRVWKMPRIGRSYLVAADVAQGVAGGNWSVAQVFDRSSWEQVATYRCRMDPGAWGRLMVNIGLFFSNAVLAPELNNHGWATVEAIKATKYPHLLRTREIWGDKEPEREGFPTTEKNRALCITALRNCIDDDTVYWNDPVTLGEMETFIVNPETGKTEAQDGCEDDCVISAGIGVYCLKFLTVDETYADRARLQKQSNFVTSLTGTTGETKRKSRTGYR